MIRLVSMLLTLCMFVSCANQVLPEGGEKDTEPPKVIKSEPDNSTVNFAGKRLELTFDEYVSLQDPQTNIVVSPLMEKQPKLKLKGKSLIVEFQDTLESNTTYSIDFGGGVKDYRENNILNDYMLVFSTGNQIDSLNISGKVYWAETFQAAEGVLVSLYKFENEQDSDTAFTTKKPFYISRTNASGNFTLNNLAKGKYTIRALDDKNGNYYFDQDNESIGFYDLPLNPADTTKQEIAILLFNEGKQKQHITEQQNDNFGHIRLVFSKPQDTLKISVPENMLSSNDYVVLPSANNDTLQFWYRNPKTDNLALAIKGDGFADSLNFRKLPDSTSLPKLEMISNLLSARGDGQLTPDAELKIWFTNPIDSIDLSKIKVMALKDSSNVSFLLTESEPSIIGAIELTFGWKSDEKYELQIPQGVVRDYFGQANDSIAKKFVQNSSDKYGSLTIYCENTKPGIQYIARVYKEDKKIKEQVFSGDVVTLDLIKEGNYKVMLVEDLNANGKWDPGNYAEKRQGEKVFAASGTVTVKAGWDTETDLNVE